jgi:uncharacterized membrane protein
MITPIHPMIVHFPIVMLLLGAAAQIIAVWKPKFFDKAANYLIVGGFATGVAAYLSGEGAEDYARAHLHAAHSAIETHQDLALWSLFIFGVVIALKVFRHMRPSIRIITPALLALTILGAGLISVTGHYGGKLVYQTDTSGAVTSSSGISDDDD